MNKTAEIIFNKIKEINDTVATISVSEINFYPSLRQLCETNYCGAYNKNYTCPPRIGEVDEVIKKVKAYETAIIFRCVYQLEDSFDIEGMDEGSANFNKLTYKIFDIAKEIDPSCLVLSAGGCRRCKVCGAVDNTPCRFPDKAISSLEAHCIQVSELAGQIGMKYINGQNTVTYFGGVFVK